MFSHILRRRARRSRTSVLPRPHARERRVPWGHPLTWVALLTLIASAIYFSVPAGGGASPPAERAD